MAGGGAAARSTIGEAGRILTGMRLLDAGRSGLDPMLELDRETLFTGYDPPRSPWLRCNMVTSLDGAATGADGRSGSINNAADHVVFEMLRASSHAVIVGAGTVRVEGYPPLAVDASWRGARAARGLPDRLVLVVVSNRGKVPESVRGVTDGSVLFATPTGASGPAAARDSLGGENVVACGDEFVDLPRLVELLHERGLTHLLTEGGPSLLGSMLAAGLVDELCFTITPQLVGGDHLRPIGPAAIAVPLDLQLLLEHEGTLMGRWFTRR